MKYENFDEVLSLAPYSLSKSEKRELFNSRIAYLTRHHCDCCDKYSKMLAAVGYDAHQSCQDYLNIPYIPVRMFKERKLLSVPEEEVIKTMTSSGTTGQAVSKIYLDKRTATNQQKAMVHIVESFTGSSRMPMIILDCPSVVKDRKMFSARGAGILGFSILGSKRMYAFDDNMNLKLEEVREFVNQYRDRKILLFGFTFIIWQHFYKELVRIKEETGETLDLSKAILIHGGGWKKLTAESVSAVEFKERMNAICGLNSVHDYYGMVEQTGCIYMECEYGHLHASNFSDVVVRNPITFKECKHGERGVIQVISTIPESYPGHSLLTEDEGVIIGEDDCPCMRKGKYFEVLGRVKNSEIRGCSDTYALDFEKVNEHYSSTVGVMEKVKFILGDMKHFETVDKIPVLPAFDSRVIEFLNTISRELLKDRRARQYSDIVSLAFWLRKASINGLKRKYLLDDVNITMGRGIAFHIAPSNVPVNFAYSLFTGLLCGNVNIVRMPTKEFRQVDIICSALRSVMAEFPQMREYVYLLRYERNRTINDYISKMCNLRVIWGGDATITELRKSALMPRTTEIVFSDRYSIALVDSDYYMSIDNKDGIAREFYNDTYAFDQNACTSPHVIVWMGNSIETAKETFYSALHRIVCEKYNMMSNNSIDKIVKEYLVASSDEKLGSIRVVRMEDNLITRIEVDSLSAELMKYRGNCGFFYDYSCNDIMDLYELCDDAKCQTVEVLGDKNALRPLIRSGIKGIDRVVSVGHTMDFDFVWDGFNLFERFTRTITC